MTNMWIFYFLLVIGATQEGRGEGDSGLGITGTATIVGNNETVLSIQVEKERNASAGIREGTSEAGGEASPEAKESIEGKFTKEEETGLAKHNEFRKVHKVPLMALDREMCDEAKAYAERLAGTGGLMHSSRRDREGQGENLSMGCSTSKAQTMEEAVTNWYNEVCDPGFNFASGDPGSGTGHFTQVVWKESTLLGIGRAEVEQGGMKCAFIVGRYRPPGNMLGGFTENVPKGSYNSSYCITVLS